MINSFLSLSLSFLDSTPRNVLSILQLVPLVPPPIYGLLPQLETRNRIIGKARNYSTFYIISNIRMASAVVAQKSDNAMADSLSEAMRQSQYHMKRCFARFVGGGKRLMKPHHIMEEMEKTIEDKRERVVLEGLLGLVIGSTQEAAVIPPYVGLSVRRNPGSWEFFKVNADELAVDAITAKDYLKLKEMIHDENWAKDENALEVDFGAFDVSTPRLTLSSSIGNGLDFISKFMASKISGDLEQAKPLLEYLLALNHHGENLMINDTLNTVSKLQTALIVADVYVSALPKDRPYQNFEPRLKEWGFEKGWGDNAERVKETMGILSEILQAPDSIKMDSFFKRLPNLFNIVIFSISGYFGQADVLGLPDTGGQVVYILDQVKALEEELLQRINHQGLSMKPQILVVTRLIPDVYEGNSAHTRCTRNKMQPGQGASR